MFVLDDEVVFEGAGGAQYVDRTVVFVILLGIGVDHVLYKLPPFHHHYYHYHYFYHHPFFSLPAWKVCVISSFRREGGSKVIPVENIYNHLRLQL